MIDGVSVNSDNLVRQPGAGSTPSPPPSPPETTGSESAQRAAEVDISTKVAQGSNKSSERVSQGEEGAKTRDGESLEKELKDKIGSLNDKLAKMDREILFKLDTKIDRHYISVVDKSSKEVIREFPPEEIRTFIARFDEFNERLSTSTDVKSLIVNLEV